jgi:putative phage-type endonuclease
MQQNTDKWINWRLKGIGSSDAPIIMNKSKYMTPLQLWHEKVVGPKPREGSNFVQELGHKFEPKALAHFCLATDLDDFYPELFEHKEVSWVRASLDGYSQKKNMIAEIKYVGQKRFEQVMDTKLPLEDHDDQIQHQFLATGAVSGFYICYTLNEKRNEIKNIGWVRVEPDMAYIKETLFPAEKAFWDCVVSGKPPEPTEKDVIELSDDDTSFLVREYNKLANEKKSIENSLKIYEEKLKKKALETGRHKVKAFNLTLSTVVRKGSIDYAKIPQLKDIDLEQYRKKATTYLSIRADK